MYRYQESLNGAASVIGDPKPAPNAADGHVQVDTIDNDCYVEKWQITSNDHDDVLTMPTTTTKDQSSRNNSYDNDTWNKFHRKKLEWHIECRERQGVLQQYIREQWAIRINQISMTHEAPSHVTEGSFLPSSFTLFRSVLCRWYASPATPRQLVWQWR